MVKLAGEDVDRGGADEREVLVDAGDGVDMGEAGLRDVEANATSPGMARPRRSKAVYCAGPKPITASGLARRNHAFAGRSSSPATVSKGCSPGPPSMFCAAR